jgi:hypothetical protein
MLLISCLLYRIILTDDVTLYKIVIRARGYMISRIIVWRYPPWPRLPCPDPASLHATLLVATLARGTWRVLRADLVVSASDVGKRA